MSVLDVAATQGRPGAAPAISRVQLSGNSVAVEWADGRHSTYLSMWLRDNCPQLQHATTHHRVVETSTIPEDVHPSIAEVDAGGNLRIMWAHDGHVSVFTAQWLRQFDYSNGARRVRPEPTLWAAAEAASIPHVSYPELLANDRVRQQYLRGFAQYGLAFLHDVPVEPGTVRSVAQQFGELRSTSWGTVFDVMSLVEANSVAYTNLPLVTHTDEGYRDPAPTVQLTHFLRSDATGGSATLTDGFKVAADLRAQHPEMFDLLATQSLYFHFAEATAEHEADGPVIVTEPYGRVKAIRYSNHSVQPFLMDPAVMEQYYAAYRRFGQMRESEQYQLRIDMQPGDMYMVDNHRVMHGRTEFATGGARHLQSCYIERDELFSRLTVLDRRLAAAPQ
jgi:gamma-butyrobetaine dioxygenase